ncbi:hypothetical protein C9I56_02670 [Paraburkholderia caribensis]|uniref:hypothetical protein n=1 Tax=Paraburkholderia caribensis TaxID=75105 RepID=UPI000D15CD4F|nr:hypothetical protein [Paraburkholderia caribensis]PTB30285.1 hypothetical protein C9I56_02670 [Paraburkholderia caribensis]
MKRTFEYAALTLVIASIILVWVATMSDPAHLKWSTWAYSEWRISYDAGFIRRGLGGWVIDRLTNRFSGSGDSLIAVNYVVFLNYVLLYAVFLVLWLRSRARSVIALTLAILIPGGLFQMALGNAYFFRKEIIFHVVLGIDCMLYGAIVKARLETQKVRLALAFFALLFVQGAILPLVHESYLFMSFPAAWLLARSIASSLPGQKRFASFTWAAVVLQAVMFAICAKFKGSEQVVAHMWSLLGPVDRARISPETPGVVTGGMEAIGWTVMNNLGGVLHIFTSGQFWIWGFAGAGTAAVLLLLTLCNTRERGAHAPLDEAPTSDLDTVRWHLAKLAFLFVTCGPMFVLGVDWGRWISSVTICYLFLMFVDDARLIAPPDLLAAVPKRWKPKVDAARDFVLYDALGVVRGTTARHRKALLLLALLFCLSFRTPECCLAMGFSPFHRLKPILTELLHMP